MVRVALLPEEHGWATSRYPGMIAVVSVPRGSPDVTMLCLQRAYAAARVH